MFLGLEGRPRRRLPLGSALAVLLAAVLVGCDNGTAGGTGANSGVFLFLGGQRPIEGSGYRLADMDNDGLPDLVTSDYRRSTAIVYLRTLPGPFASFSSFPLGERSYRPLIGDFDLDGNVDLLSWVRSEPQLSVLLGDGDGGFEPEHWIPLPTDVDSTLTGWALGNFNVDAHLDLVLSNRHTIYMLLNPGNGEFGLFDRVDVPSGTGSFRSADFDNDGVDDLLALEIGDAGQYVWVVRRNDGKGRLGPPMPVGGEGPGIEFTDAQPGDFNDDGLMDVVRTRRQGDRIEALVLLGQGNGTFVEQPSSSFPASLDAPYETGDIYPVDLTNDGVPDLVVRLYTGDSSYAKRTYVLVGDGDGVFEPPAYELADYDIGEFAVDDFNLDGNPDIFAEHQIFLGNGDGTFKRHPRLPVGDMPSAVVTLDLNADGALDLVTANEGSHDLSILLGKGDGTFQPETRVPVAISPQDLVSGGPFLYEPVRLADFNGDGRTDLVVWSTRDGLLTPVKNNGDGTVTPLPTRSIAALRLYRRSDPVDLDDDGSADLAVRNTETGEAGILYGDAENGFEPFSAIVQSQAIYDLDFGDMNHDGLIDIVLLDGEQSAIETLIAEPGRRYADTVISRVNQGSDNFAVLQLNADGVPDIVVANSDDRYVATYLGHRDGSFSLGNFYPTGGYASVLPPIDLDGDGSDDVVVLDLASSLDVTWEARVFKSLKNGNLNAMNINEFSFFRFAGRATYADLTGDGAPELLRAPYGDWRPSALINAGAGDLTSLTWFNVEDNAYDLAHGDWDNDGDIDLATTLHDPEGAVVLMFNRRILAPGQE